MKLRFFLNIILLNMPCISIIAMDFTPPNPLPTIMKEESGKHDEMPVPHKRHSRQHTILEINASMVDADGKETQLKIKEDGTLEKSGDTSGSTDSKSAGYTKRYIATTNCITAIVTGSVGAGVALAIKFAACKKD